MTFKQQFSMTLLATAILTACGGGGGGGGGDPLVDGGGGIPDIANGGIGGSGSGTVTGFGSIIVNDIRRFGFNDDTVVRIDDKFSGEDDIKLGMVVSVNVGDDASDDFTRGTLVSVDVHHVAKGPVTATNPLRVLGQEISVVTSTVLDDIPGNQVSNLDIGDIVEVSGHRDSAGIIRATRIEGKSAAEVTEWQLRGTLAAVNENTSSLTLGSQTYIYNLSNVDDCNGTLGAGSFVELKFIPFTVTSGNEVFNVSKVECELAGIVTDDSVSGSVRASFEGFIDSTGTNTFTINGQRVNVSATTVYENGSNLDLRNGAKVEAEGRLDTASGVLTATKVRFREARFRMSGPLYPQDVNAAVDTLTLFGLQINLLRSTEFDGDDSDTNYSGYIQNGLPQPVQVEVRGFIDSSGAAYAEEIEFDDDIDSEDTEVRGPVSKINSNGFEMLGLTVIIDGAQLKDDDDSDDSDDGKVFSSGQAFLDALRIGVEVSVDDAFYDSAAQTLYGGEIELED